ncbi:COP9/signalosome complex subunit Csn2, partial [Podochytrium sp. JEL0797]
AYPYIQNIGDARGYTTNIVGFCSGTGDLVDMLKNLQTLEPCNPLVKYLPDIQKLSKSGSDQLTGLAGFAELVVQQGGGPTGNGPINPFYIQATWNTLAAATSSEGSNYWGQAMALSRKYQLSLPISKGQLFDISLNAGTDAAIKLASQVKVPSPASGGNETTWLLALQSLWLQYIQDHPSIDDQQPDRGLMWQHLVNPKASGKNSGGQVGANNKQANLQLTLPISVNCYGSTINIAAA